MRNLIFVIKFDVGLVGLMLIETSPIPAGSRVTFFAGPKKVTKETTALRWAM